MFILTTSCGRLFQFGVDLMLVSIPQALSLIEQGGIIAYPTEAVFGLGGSPFHQEALERIYTLKGRPKDKGMILLINSYDQLWPLTTLSKNDPLMTSVKEAWPGHTTFLFPKSDAISLDITGGSQKIAIRMSQHPIASALCEKGPIISTSANPSGQPAIQSMDTLISVFGNKVDGIVKGDLGNAKKPSTIIDLVSKQIIR